MPNPTSFIVYAARTPVGKFMGGLSEVPAPQLGGVIVRDALEKTSVEKERVDEIIMGQVLPAGCGQAPARQTGIFGGLPDSVRATTVNRVCGSGIKSVMFADQAIRLGDQDIVFAGGQENMSLAPHLLPHARKGYRFGRVTARDHMQFDGLWDPYNDVAMGVFGETCAKEYGFTREAQDAYAIESYERARRAAAGGAFGVELVSVEAKFGRKSVLIKEDEEPASVDLDRLASLRPAFDKNGTLTAGNSSSINDGAALVVAASEVGLKYMAVEPLVRVVSQASHAQDPKWFTTAPIACIKKLLDKSKLGIEDIDLFEINEAFAAVPMAAIRDLKLDPERVNPMGGAVALGHPIGASGTRILVTLIHALRAKGLRRGLAVLCIGGGEASGVIVETV